jgi:hypothetical protein
MTAHYTSTRTDVEKVMVGAGGSVLGWLPVVAYLDERVA